jgi:ribose transport system substrate-binding protein
MKTFMVTAAIVAGVALGAPAMAQTKPVISVIVKDTTSPYWQAVLAGARKAGQELGVNVVELGAESETDAIGQMWPAQSYSLESLAAYSALPWE